MTVTVSFAYTGAPIYWTVPQNLDTTRPVTIDLKGAGGAFSDDGEGEHIVGTMSLTPGQPTAIYIGGCGKAPVGNNGGLGGFNGGGRGGSVANTSSAPGYGGGGATDIRVGGTFALADRKVVAAGGGGSGRTGSAGTRGHGGDGGAATGQAGVNGTSPSTGGGGGTSSAGGAAGTPGTGTSGTGTAGTLGQGGHGSDHSGTGLLSGGGGGGGWYGGGGGGGAVRTTASSSGGGGGSGYVGGLLTTTTNTRGGGALPGHNGSASITYSVIPNSPSLNLPTPNSSIDLNLTTTVTWTFSCADPSEVQTAAETRWRIGTGAWTTVTASTDATASHVFAANYFASYVGQTIEWQVRTQGAVAYGPWSASSYFIVRDEPTDPTFTATPVIDSQAPGLAFHAPDGMCQYQWQLTADSAGAPGSVLLDSGTVLVNTALGFPTDVNTVLNAFVYANGTNYHVLIRYAQYAGVWSSWIDSGPVTASIDSPLQPTATITELLDTASVRVDVTNPGSDPFPPDHNDIYRTDLQSGVETRIATDLAPGGTFTDYRAGFSRAYRYRVVAVTVTGAFTSSV